MSYRDASWLTDGWYTTPTTTTDLLILLLITVKKNFVLIVGASSSIPKPNFVHPLIDMFVRCMMKSVPGRIAADVFSLSRNVAVMHAVVHYYVDRRNS